MQFRLAKTLASTRPALVQFVTPEHHTRATFPDGLPAVLDVDLVRGVEAWSLDAALGGKDMDLQHQDFDPGAVKVRINGAPNSVSLDVNPRAEQALVYSASSGSNALDVESNWGGGFVRADLTGGVPSKFLVDANGLLPGEGGVSTQGTGDVGHTDVLVVPDGGSTVNRLNTRGDHVAVELMAKTPYLSVDVHDLESFTWTLPDATTARPFTAGLERSVPRSGESTLLLSGPREDVTAKITDSSASTSMTYDPRSGPTDSIQVGYDCTGGSTGKFAFTHMDVENGEMLNSYLTQCQGNTLIQATGAEPATVSLDATNAQGGVLFQTTDQGTVLHVEAEDIPTDVEAVLERGSTTVSPFKGHVSTQGTGSTGPIEVQIGDGGRVPALRGDGLDARRTSGQAMLAYQAPSGTGSNWDTTECAAEYEFAANRGRSTYYVETEDGFLRAAAELQNYDEGNVSFQFTNGQGIVHDATDRLAVLEEEVTFPTCQQFQSPLKWYKLNGQDVPSDLALNLNPKTGTGGGTFETIQIESPSKSPSGKVSILGQVDKVAEENQYRAQILYLSPFDDLDVHLFDTDGPRTAQGIHRDRVVSVLDGGFDYHTRMSGVKTFDGDVEHLECGGEDEVNVDLYERIPGRQKQPITFVMDLGNDCDKQRFDIDSYPDTFEYHIKWDNLFDNRITASASEPIEELQWWRLAHQVGDTKVRGAGPVAWYTGVNDVPVGKLDVSVKMGVAGQIKARSNGGDIGSIEFGVATAQGSDWYYTMTAHRVDLHVEWDLDGDTKFSGLPRYIYADTGGGSMGVNQRMRFGDVGVGTASVDVWFDKFQLRWGMTDLGFGVEGPWIKRTGSFSFAPGSSVEVLWPNGNWYKVPLNLLD